MARMRSGKRRLFVAAMTIVAAGLATWWWRSSWHNGSGKATIPAQADPSPPAARPAPVPSAGDSPSPASSAPLLESAPAVLTAAQPQPIAATTRPADDPVSLAAHSSMLAEASAALAAGKTVQARRLFNQALDPLADSPANEQIIRQLTRLGDEMIFSSKVVQSDPLVVKHIVEPGQNLQKIANLYKTTVPFICRLNNLANPNVLRQGQALKVVLGPFHALITKHNFRMYVYCQDTLVKVFPVGLGAEDTTPAGRWKVRNKLVRPPYYPPRGGKVVAADDPANPLGGYWMGLEGIEGEAVGADSYGIHGTIEPETIGKNASLGCIRLHNEDVALVYELLVVHDSIVTVKN